MLFLRRQCLSAKLAKSYAVMVSQQDPDDVNSGPAIFHSGPGDIGLRDCQAYAMRLKQKGYKGVKVGPFRDVMMILNVRK